MSADEFLQRQEEIWQQEVEESLSCSLLHHPSRPQHIDFLRITAPEDDITDTPPASPLLPVLWVSNFTGVVQHFWPSLAIIPIATLEGTLSWIISTGRSRPREKIHLGLLDCDQLLTNFWKVARSWWCWAELASVPIPSNMAKYSWHPSKGFVLGMYVWVRKVILQKFFSTLRLHHLDSFLIYFISLVTLS